MPQDWRVPNQVIDQRPFGTTMGDKLKELELALLQAEMDRAAQEAAKRKKMETEARLADPLERQRVGEQMQRFDMRRNVVPVEPEAEEPTLPGLPRGRDSLFGPTVKGVRQMPQAPSSLPKVSLRSRKATTGGLVEMEREAAQFTDPNSATAFAGRAREASIDPRVLAAKETGAARVMISQQAGGKGDESDEAIRTNLARMGSLALQLNKAGGPSGVVAGGVRRLVTGPSQVDEFAREFEGIKGATALAIAAKLNKGRPTEADRQAAEAILPQAGDAPSLVRRKMRLVMQTLGQGDTSELTDPLSGEVFSLMDEGSGAPSGPAKSGRFEIVR